MATEVTCIVDTDATQSPDYTGLNAALVGERSVSPKVVTSSDLVTNDEQLTIECRATTGVADTTKASFTGWTTDATRYIKVHSPYAHRHDGKWNTSKYRLETAGDWNNTTVCFLESPCYYYFENLQISSSANNSHTFEMLNVETTDATRIYVRNCIIRHTHATSERYTVNGFSYVNSADHAAVFNNCMLLNASQSGYVVYSNINGNGQKQYFYNCTFSGGGYSFYRTGGSSYGSTYARNCIFYNPGTDIDGQGALHVDYASYCKTDITTTQLDSITGGADEATFTFVDAANYDFRLQSTDTGAKDAGTDISSNPDSAPLAPLSTDIIYTARPYGSGWDLGAYEFYYIALATSPCYGSYNPGANNSATGSFDITVPEDADCLIVYVTGYKGAPNVFTDTGCGVTCEGEAADAVLDGCDDLTYRYMGAGWVFLNPATGSGVTLAWTWSTTLLNYPLFCWVAYKGVGSVRNSAGNQDGSLPYSQAFVAESGDKISCCVMAFQGSTGGSIESWTNATEISEFDHNVYSDLTLAEHDPTGNVTITVASGTNYTDGAFGGFVLSPPGTVCWGHDTSVAEDITRDFSSNWTGTGRVISSGDSEKILLPAGTYMESETWNLGSMTAIVDLDKYGAGGYGSVVVKYKQGSSAALCEAEEWATYSIPFACSGYIKLRLEPAT